MYDDLSLASGIASIKDQEGIVALKLGQRVRCNLAGMMVEGVVFSQAVTDAVGTVIQQTSSDPPQYLVKLLFSFKGANRVEVPEDRIKPM